MASNQLFAIMMISIIALGVGFIGWVLPGQSKASGVSLGVWNNMPAAQTELMGNSSYRGLAVFSTSGGESGFEVGLQVGCVNPSNTPGALLTLQYANYTQSLHMNSSNFVSTTASVPIDGSWACPSTLASGVFTMPALTVNPTIFIFRVVGSGGGGAGDNPRFSSVNVFIEQFVRRVSQVLLGTPSTTTFGFQTQVTFPVVSSTTITVQWMATNITGAGGCGFSTDHCWESGSSSATINAGLTASSTATVTFSVAFTGTVHVTATPVGAGLLTNLFIGTISLLSAQTLTV